MIKTVPKQPRRRKYRKIGGSIMREVNLSGISIVANNIDNQPNVFEKLKPTEQVLVKKITGRYPKLWNAKTKSFQGKVTVGKSSTAKFSVQW